MSRMKLLGLMLLTVGAFTVSAAEEAVVPIGIFVDANTDADTNENALEATQPQTTVVRDGKAIEAVAGMEIYPGDVVETAKAGGIVLAFTNNNIVELGGASKLTVGNDIAQQNAGSIVINHGHVAVASNEVQGKNMNISLGASQLASVRASGSGATKLDVIQLPDSKGVFTSTVACTSGTATLTGVSATKVNVTSGSTALLTVNNAVTGITGTATKNIDSTTVSKTDLKALQATLKTASTGSEILVTVGKSSITYKSTIKNADGSVTKDILTTSADGKSVLKDTSSTKSSTIAVSSKSSNGKTTVKQTYNGTTFTSTISGTSGPASIKVNGQTYKGTATLDPKTGTVTFTTTTPAKDGSTSTYTFNPDTGGSAVVTPSGGKPGTPVTFTPPVTPPPAAAGGVEIGQNNQPTSN